jgi:hypothetical protein
MPDSDHNIPSWPIGGGFVACQTRELGGKFLTLRHQEPAVSITTYLPNSSGSSGKRGNDYNRPPDTLLMDNESTLSTPERNTISVNNDSVILVTASGGYYPGVRLWFGLSEAEGDVTKLTLTARGRSKRTGSWGFYMYVADDSDTWQYLAHHTNAILTTLTEEITTNLTNYISGGLVRMLVMGYQAGVSPPISSSLDLDFAELRVKALV